MNQNSEHENIDLDKIKERIAKLMRMAEDASSPAEAAIAASRVKKLKDKYDLHHFNPADGFKDEFGETAATRAFAAMPEYLKVFCCAVAKYNDCVAVLKRDIVDFKKSTHDAKKVGNVIWFQGYKSDVELAKNMWDSLEKAINRLCREYLADKGYVKYPVGVGGKFKMAAMTEICNRIDAMIVERDALTQMKDAEGACTSLVVIKEEAVKEHFDFPGYKKSKSKPLTDASEAHAYMAGREAGKKIEITKGLE